MRVCRNVESSTGGFRFPGQSRKECIFIRAKGSGERGEGSKRTTKVTRPRRFLFVFNVDANPKNFNSNLTRRERKIYFFFDGSVVC